MGVYLSTNNPEQNYRAFLECKKETCKKAVVTESMDQYIITKNSCSAFQPSTYLLKTYDQAKKIFNAETIDDRVFSIITTLSIAHAASSIELPVGFFLLFGCGLSELWARNKNTETHENDSRYIAKLILPVIHDLNKHIAKKTQEAIEKGELPAIHSLVSELKSISFDKIELITEIYRSAGFTQDSVNLIFIPLKDGINNNIKKIENVIDNPSRKIEPLEISVQKPMPEKPNLNTLEPRLKDLEPSKDQIKPVIQENIAVTTLVQQSA
jgi:hypothetical protein